MQISLLKVVTWQVWIVLFLSVTFQSCGVLKYPSTEKSTSLVSDHISDLMLIYHGGGHRPKWNSDELKHYVFRENKGQIEWLFDGFLFMEIRAEFNNKAYDFGVGKASTLKPTQTEWKWLIDKNFAAKHGPGAIEYLLDSMDKSGNPAPFKRKIVLGIPNPIEGTENWGIVNGVPLDFEKDEDRVAAVKWYIDESIKQFKEQNYKYLELEGFYWINESIDKDFAVIEKVNEYVHQQNLTSCWIPYNYAPGAERWKAAGFDIAYQQSNYFFTLDKPKSIMTRALNFAKDNGMAMEMEFDDRIFKPSFLPRFYDYIEMYDQHKVWESQSVAYYEGGGAWMRMAKSSDPAVLKAFKDMSDIVVKRQNSLADSLKNLEHNYYKKYHQFKTRVL